MGRVTGLLPLFVGGLFLAAFAEFLQFQPGGGVGFVFFGIKIALFTLGTFESNRHSGGFLGHCFSILQVNSAIV